MGAHFGWRVGDTAMHADGTKPAWVFLTSGGRAFAKRKHLSLIQKMELQTLSQNGAMEFMTEPATYRFRLPALNPSLALRGEGDRCGSCFTAAWNAWSRANYHIPNAVLGYAAYEWWFERDEP